MVMQMTEINVPSITAATNQLEAPARIREVRRTIAKIKTLQSERSRSAEAKA